LDELLCNRKMRKVHQLVQIPQYSHANQLLLSDDTMAPANEHTLERLQAKHPEPVTALHSKEAEIHKFTLEEEDFITTGDGSSFAQSSSQPPKPRHLVWTSFATIIFILKLQEPPEVSKFMRYHQGNSMASSNS